MPARASTCARTALKRLHHLRGSHSTRSRTTCLRWFQNEPRGHHRGPAPAASHLPGPILQGPLPFQLPSFVRIVTDEETKPAVAALVANGVDFIKVGDTLTRAAYFGIAEESRRLGVPFARRISGTPDGSGWWCLPGSCCRRRISRSCIDGQSGSVESNQILRIISTRIADSFPVKKPRPGQRT